VPFPVQLFAKFALDPFGLAAVGGSRGLKMPDAVDPK
jgi:hypothetical protein